MGEYRESAVVDAASGEKLAQGASLSLLASVSAVVSTTAHNLERAMLPDAAPAHSTPDVPAGDLDSAMPDAAPSPTSTSTSASTTATATAPPPTTTAAVPQVPAQAPVYYYTTGPRRTLVQHPRQRGAVETYLEFARSTRTGILQCAVQLRPDIVRGFRAEEDKKAEVKEKARVGRIRAKERAVEKGKEVKEVKGRGTEGANKRQKGKNGQAVPLQVVATLTAEQDPDSDHDHDQDQDPDPPVPDTEAFDLHIRSITPPRSWLRDENGRLPTIIFVASVSHKVEEGYQDHEEKWRKGKVPKTLWEAEGSGTREGALEGLEEVLEGLLG